MRIVWIQVDMGKSLQALVVASIAPFITVWETRTLLAGATNTVATMHRSWRSN